MRHPSDAAWNCPTHGTLDEGVVQVGSNLCPHCLDAFPPVFQTLSMGKPVPRTTVQDYDPTWDETDDAMREVHREIGDGFGRAGAFRRRS